MDDTIAFGFLCALNAHSHYATSTNILERTAVLRLRAAVLDSLRHSMDAVTAHISDPWCA